MSFRRIFTRIANIARASSSDWRGRDTFDDKLRRAEELIRDARHREEHAARQDAEQRAWEEALRTPPDDPLAAAYRTLGVPPTASLDEVTRAYRALIVVHHPDRHARLGTQEQERARRKAQEVNDAYRMIKDRRRGV